MERAELLPALSKMAEVNEYTTKDSFIIEVKLNEKDDRVCDYCNRLLVSYDEQKEKLICVENCYSTNYGLLCEKCRGNIDFLQDYRKDEEYREYSQPNPLSEKLKRLIQKFRSKRNAEIYEVILTEKGLSCNCKGWIFRRYCKHLAYVLDNLAMRDEQGRIVNFVSEITDIPTYQEALTMDFGRNKAEAEKWQREHIKVIEL